MSNDDEAGPSGHSEQAMPADLESVCIENGIVSTRADARVYVNNAIRAELEENEWVLEDLKEQLNEAIQEEIDREDELAEFIADESNDGDTGSSSGEDEGDNGGNETSVYVRDDDDDDEASPKRNRGE